MKYLFYTWKLGCLLLLVFAGCSSKKSVSSYHSFESECLGVELDGFGDTSSLGQREKSY